MQSIGIGIGINSGGAAGVPFASDAFAIYDGTIIYSAPNYYFVDKKSGKNLLITGYDFDTTWLKGFPYKSDATISSPAGDAAFIAIDLNNYWYASNGTPNQIPVISLFQDIDYEHKFFFKHLAQELDVNGVETFEPRVSEWVIYNNVKTGADLTKCQTYFVVPVENPNAKWVTKAGNDSTGTGTKAAPFLTIMKAYKTVVSGSEIYVKTGVFTEEYNNTSLRYMYLDRVGIWTVKGIGLNDIRTITTSNMISSANSNMNFYNFNINCYKFFNRNELLLEFSTCWVRSCYSIRRDL